MGSRPAETAPAAEPTAPATGATAEGSAGQPRPGVPASATGGTAAPAAEAAEATVAGEARRHAIEFDLTVDIIYHRTRQAFLLLLHRWAMFGTIIGGTVAVSDAFGLKTPAILGASCGALDLVFDFSGRAAVHGELVRELMDIVRALYEADVGEAACASATTAWLRLSAGEPAPFHAARDLAYNQAIVALGRDERHWVEVSWPRWLFANWWRFEGSKPHSPGRGVDTPKSGGTSPGPT